MKTDFEKKILKIRRNEQALFQNDPARDADDRQALYYEGLISASGEKNLALLKKAGVDLSGQDSEGRDLLALLEDHRQATKYPHSKKGDLDRLKDERILKELRRMQNDGSLSGTGKKRRKLHLALLLALVLLLALASFTYSYHLFTDTTDIIYSTQTTETTESD